MRSVIRLQKDLVWVGIALNIFRFGVAMSGVFIPLIILQKGEPLWVVAAFYVGYALVKLLLNYPVTRLIQRVGAHMGLGLGFAAAGVQLASILGFSWTSDYLFLATSFTGLALANAFVWNSQHIHISRVIDPASKSSNIATIEIVGQAADIAAPLLGGVVGALFGPGGLLAASLAVLAASIIPLRKMGTLRTTASSMQLRYSLRGAPRRDLVANMCFNIETSIGVMLWPIYLAVVLKTFGAIGAVTAIAATATIMTVWLAGRRGDTGKDRRILMEGAALSSLSHILRIIALTPLAITGVSVLYRASLAYLQNAWVSTYYAHAQRHGLQYIMSMEIACDLAYLLMWGGLLTVLLLSGSQTAFFAAAFLVAAAAAWGCLLISQQSKLESSSPPQ